MRIPILVYHSVGTYDSQYSIAPDVFTGQMRMLKKLRYTPIFLTDLLTANGYDNPIVITFDDAFENFYTDAYPLLSELKFKCTCFVPTGLVGKTNEWAPTEPVQPLMTWERIQELQASGVVDFQSHGVSHVALTNVEYGERRREFLDSKVALQTALGKEVNCFSYPFGSANSVIMDEAKETGYRLAVSNVGGIENTIGMDLMALKRIPI